MLTLQAAIPSPIVSAMKRHAPTEFDEVDSENIDPLAFSSSSKKARGFDFDLRKSSQAPRFICTPAKPAQYVQRAQAAGYKRKAEEPAVTPETVQSSKRLQPSSAPAPAGRSPTRGKKTGILSRRRMTASPFTRINPPTSSSTQSTVGLPFSIDAALAGTVPAYKSKLKSKSTHRKSWQFDIHEDTPEDEMANLMEHSTCTLDISDDESRATSKGDKDNKENIPPADGLLATTSSQAAVTRRDLMTDEPRDPLGDLDAKNFYAEGCDATSIVLVAAEDGTDEKAVVVSTDSEPCSRTRLRANATTDSREEWKDVITQVANKAAAVATDSELPPLDGSAPGGSVDIQIWESESAKGGDDVDAQGPGSAECSSESMLI